MRERRSRSRGRGSGRAGRAQTRAGRETTGLRIVSGKRGGLFCKCYRATYFSGRRVNTNKNEGVKYIMSLYLTLLLPLVTIYRYTQFTVTEYASEVHQRSPDPHVRNYTLQKKTCLFLLPHKPLCSIKKTRKSPPPPPCYLNHRLRPPLLVPVLVDA
jgi:hypothetical protein